MFFFSTTFSGLLLSGPPCTYQVRTAITLKKNEDVLSKPKRSVKKGIDEKSINNVISFYLDDEFLREMPGAKEYVRIGYKTALTEKIIIRQSIRTVCCI